MNLVLLGPPGAGKGTQAEKLITEYGLKHVATGDMFRAAVSNGTPMGLEAKKYMDAGKLVPDDVVVGMVEERLAQDDVEDGFMLDGFPRNTHQAEALDAFLEKSGRSIDLVLNIAVDPEMLVKRLTGRRVCRDCGGNYHVLFSPSEAGDKCAACGGELYLRDDDNEQTVRSRLDVYRNQTEPVIGYYRPLGKLGDIDGALKPDEVFEQIIKAIGATEESESA